MGSALAASAIRSYVVQMTAEMAEMLENIGDPLAPQARALALSLAEKPAEYECRPPA